MLYLGSFNKNYFSVGNNPFFYQEGKSYPDDCNIKVPCFTVFDGYSSTGTYSKYSNIVSYHSILYYAPFFNNYVLANISYNRGIYTINTLYPILVTEEVYDVSASGHSYLYNMNGKSMVLPNLFFCKELTVNNTDIEDCYYSVNSSLNRYSGSGSMGYTYTSYGVFPKFEYDVIGKYSDYTKLSSSDGGFYVDNMKFDFSSKIAAKGINACGYNSGEEVSLFWTFFGYIRSNTAIDLTPENNFIEDKVAGKYESILCRNGDITSNSLSSIYLGLSLYKMSFDDLDLYIYMLKDVGSMSYGAKTINKTDNSVAHYTEVGKDTKNKVSIGDIQQYELNSDNVFVRVFRGSVINIEDSLQIGGYWKSDYLFSKNNYRIDEETTITFTYVKNEDSAKTYSDIDLKYSGSTLDFSFLSIKPACFTMELQRLGD